MAVYDFKKVNVIINGRYVTDYADGSVVSISRNSDTYNKAIGAKGETDYAKTNDSSGTVTITLKDTSYSNRWLTEYAEEGKFLEVSVIDSNAAGFVKVSGNRCVIMRPADISKGQEIGQREWTIDIDKMIYE